MRQEPDASGEVAIAVTGRAERARGDRLTNLGLACLLAAAFTTGFLSNTFGTPVGRPLVIAHGAAGFGLLVLSFRKSRIAAGSLGRPRRRRGWWLSLLMAALVVVTVSSGLLETTGVTYDLGALTVMQIHIGAAVIVAVLVVVHYRQRPLRLRSGDLSRRTFLRTAGVGAAAGGLWVAWEGVLQATAAPGAHRRFTGSHENASGDAAAMPVTQWLDDSVQQIEPADWRLHVGARTLTLADLSALPQDDVTAVLDCTSLWWSEQRWSGVRLDRLLDLSGAASIEVRSATGYSRRFPARDLDKLWLGLSANGAPLTAGHGFPARIIAPGRRGFWWVKWVTSIEPSSVPAWLQLPYPIT